MDDAPDIVYRQLPEGGIPRRLTARWGDEDIEYARSMTPVGTVLVAAVLMGAGFVLGLVVALLPVA